MRNCKSYHAIETLICCHSLTVFLQFIREYTGKVDELIKDKIEAQKETKAKEQEEKDVIAQQVASYDLSFTTFLYPMKYHKFIYETIHG